MPRETFVRDRNTGEIVLKEEYLRRQEAQRTGSKFQPKKIERVVGARYVYDRARQKVVEASEYYRDRPRPGVHLIKDLQPYKSMVTGETIDGRRAHRDHLRRHDVVEIGNEKNYAGKKPEIERPEYDLKRVMESYGL